MNEADVRPIGFPARAATVERSSTTALQGLLGHMMSIGEDAFDVLTQPELVDGLAELSEWHFVDHDIPNKRPFSVRDEVMAMSPIGEGRPLGLIGKAIRRGDLVDLRPPSAGNEPKEHEPHLVDRPFEHIEILAKQSQAHLGGSQLEQSARTGVEFPDLFRRSIHPDLEDLRIHARVLP